MKSITQGFQSKLEGTQHPDHSCSLSIPGSIHTKSLPRPSPITVFARFCSSVCRPVCVVLPPLCLRCCLGTFPVSSSLLFLCGCPVWLLYWPFPAVDALCMLSRDLLPLSGFSTPVWNSSGCLQLAVTVPSPFNDLSTLPKRAFTFPGEAACV